MVPGTNGHIGRVQNGADVVGVHAVNGKGQNAAVLLCFFRADHMHIRHGTQSLQGKIRQRYLLGVQLVPPNGGQVVNGGGQTYRTGGVHRAGFKFMGQGA